VLFCRSPIVRVQAKSPPSGDFRSAAQRVAATRG
jgi:hypothetical protein